MNPIQPTEPKGMIYSEEKRWNSLFQGKNYYYGFEPGPLARRAVRYHRGAEWNNQHRQMIALDAGCGEGQDLVFLAQQGYNATGIELTANGVVKAQQLLKQNGLVAEVRQEDLRDCHLENYDLIMAANSVQFLGTDGPLVLKRLIASVAPGGVIGLSLFALEEKQNKVEGSIWRTTLMDLQTLLPEGKWQWLEAANLWQWNTQTNKPQAFITLIASKKL